MTLQRTVHIAPLHTAPSQSSGDLHYWLAQPVQARLAAVEHLRRQFGGPDVERRLQRVCRIAPLKPG
jgi:hypothetical protein